MPEVVPRSRATQSTTQAPHLTVRQLALGRGSVVNEPAALR